jgi:hypothetical protein
MEKRFHNHYYSQTKQQSSKHNQKKRLCTQKHSTTTIKKIQTSLAIIAKINKKEERESD